MNEQQQCQIGPCRQLEERQISRAEGGEDLPSNCQDEHRRCEKRGLSTSDVRGRPRENQNPAQIPVSFHHLHSPAEQATRVEAGITSCRSELGKSSFRAKANTAFQGVDALKKSP